MFTDFDRGFDPGDGTTKIFVRRNGADAPPKEMHVPPTCKLSDLFEKAAKVLDMDAPQLAFYSNGVECTDLDHIEDGEVIIISTGEPFKAPKSGQGQGSQVVGNYIIHEKLGQGGFGSVMKGVHSETGEVAAIKFVSKASFKQIADLQRVYQEIQALRNLHHPNVVGILDVADNPENVCFIMEFCSGGELRGYVERHCYLEEEESKVFFKQIARAIHYCHNRKIIHRDLKLENILLDCKNQCKIVDFGLSDYVSSKERTVTDAGTEAYLAPEVYNGSSGEADPYKIDVWGLGVILYALAHGRLPFSRPDIETCQRLVADGGPQYREELTAEYRRYVTAMLIPSPAKRYSMDEVTLDPWITSNRFTDMSGSCDEDDLLDKDLGLPDDEDAVASICRSEEIGEVGAGCGPEELEPQAGGSSGAFAKASARAQQGGSEPSSRRPPGRGGAAARGPSARGATGVADCTGAARRVPSQGRSTLAVVGLVASRLAVPAASRGSAAATSTGRRNQEKEPASRSTRH